MFLFRVTADGNCMVQSILEPSMKTEDVINRYSSVYLRRQFINHGCNNIEVLRPFLEKNIRELYGSGEGDIGPFSICSYFEYMLEDKAWGDLIFVPLVASVWGVRIITLRCDNLNEIRYRHDGPLKEVCIRLLYNGKEEAGRGEHFSPLVKVDGEFLDSTELFVSDVYYDEEVDKEKGEIRGRGRLQWGDNILVFRARLIELVKKEKQLEKIQAVVRGQAKPGEGECKRR